MSVSISQNPNSFHGLESSEPARFRVFAFGVIILTSALLLLAAMSRPTVPTVSPGQFLAWVLLVAFAGFVPLNSRRGLSLAMDLPLLLAAAFVFDPLTAGLIALVGATDIREWKRKVTFTRALWNRSQTCLSVMAASWVFGSFGGLGDWPTTPMVAFVALCTDALVNYLIVASGTSLRTGVRFREALASMRIGSTSAFLFSYGCFGFLGFLMAEAHAAFGLPGVVASFAPIVLGRQAFHHRSRLDDAELTLAANTDALRRVDERIADERQDERARIAEALHDEVLQDLYNVTLRAQVLRQDLLSGRLLDLEDDLPAVIRASEVAVEDLREVIHGLRSATIGHAGLVETLTLLARHLEDDSGVKVVVFLDPSLCSTPEQDLVKYQIAREALTNAIRHAQARTIWLSLRRTSNGWEEVIEDDGHGFDREEALSRLHFGLRLMNERAASISCVLDINSRPGSGTVVRLHPDIAQARNWTK